MLREDSKINSRLSFFILSTVLLALRLFAIIVNNLELYADEAQYWVWSQHLDFGYYSKPPLVAWFIAISTHIFGNSEFGVRFLSPVLHYITGFIVYLIGKNFSNRTAFIAGIIYITIPAVFVSSFLMSTDPILLLLWALALYSFIKAVKTDRLVYWALCGIASGLGMLAKYNMLFFLISVFLYLYYLNRNFRFVYSKGFILALILAIAIFFPNLKWNIDNMFVSFMHTADLVQGDASTKYSLWKMLEFFFAQFGVFGPVTFSLLIVAGYFWLKGKLDSDSKLLVYFSLPILLFMLVISFISRAHANWAAPIYIASSVLIVLIAEKLNKLNWLKYSIILHLILGLTIMLYQPVLNNFGVKVSPKYDIFQRLRGGKELGERILLMKLSYPNSIVVADTRRQLSIINYYTRSNNLEIIKWNPEKKISDYYALTTNANHYLNQNMLVISEYTDETRKLIELNNLSKYASNVKFIDVIELSSNAKLKYQVFYLENFKGY